MSFWQTKKQALLLLPHDGLTIIRFFLSPQAPVCIKQVLTAKHGTVRRKGSVCSKGSCRLALRTLLSRPCLPHHWKAVSMRQNGHRPPNNLPVSSASKSHLTKSRGRWLSHTPRLRAQPSTDTPARSERASIPSPHTT